MNKLTPLLVLSATIFIGCSNANAEIQSGKKSGILSTIPNSLLQTNLFSETVKGCREVDLSKWKHPTREVLITSGAQISKLLLCNKNKYPVFFVRFPYDPSSSQTKEYFYPLHTKLLKANGNWAFSMVSMDDKYIISVSSDKKKNLNLYEESF